MFRIGFLFLAYLAVPAFAALGAQTSRQLQTTTVADLAFATPSLSTLVTAVTTADLTQAFSDPEATLTVFAPDDDAFGGLPAGLLQALLTPGFKKHLTEILFFHVFADAGVLSSAIAATQNIVMVNGESLTVNKSDTAITVTTTAGQTATVTTVDVEGSNGVVHIIDGVLAPSSIGATVIDLGAKYSTLLSLIATAGLEETLAAGGPLTLFAPTNTAFEALDATTVDFLTTADGAADLAFILTYHVIRGSMTSDLVVDEAVATALQGQKVTLSVEGGTVMVNDATVVDPDMLAFNGVAHGIDRILMPGTLFAVADATESLSFFVAAVTAAGLMDSLRSSESLTVFAPDNDAFGALPAGFLQALLTPGFKKHLQEILLFHVYADGALLVSELAVTQEVEMLNVEMLAVSNTDTAITVTTTAGQTAVVTMADLEGSNGVMHIIDGVLAPSSIGASVIDLGAKYSSLLSVIAVLELEEALAGGPFTLFAPTNTAFAALDADTVTLLASADGRQMLVSILTHHVINGSVTSDLVVDGAMATTEQGGQVTFSVDGGTVMVNDATVIDPDMLAVNGVAHGIDRILMPPWVTIGDLAVATKSLSSLKWAVTAAGLVDALNDPRAFFTLLAPDNDAFGALPAGLLQALLTPGFKKHLQEILLFHVYADGAFMVSALAATQEVEMSNGERLTINSSDTAVTVATTAGQTAMVTLADLEGSNGVMHIINDILIPSSIGATVIDLGAKYSILLSLIARAGLEEALAGGPFTLFAPTNTAFEALDAATVDFLTSDDGAVMLNSILEYHVVSGSATSDMVMNDMTVATVQGDMVTFMVEGGTVKVNDATVVVADMLAFNGVTHGIDKVLMPPDSMAPSNVPASGGFALKASLSAFFTAALAIAL
jgi:transforming growth factor-beta-induced protein